MGVAGALLEKNFFACKVLGGSGSGAMDDGEETETLLIVVDSIDGRE